MGRNSGSAPGFEFCLEGVGQMCDFTQIHGLQLVFWPDGQGLGRNMIEKWKIKLFWGKRYVERSL